MPCIPTRSFYQDVNDKLLGPPFLSAHLSLRAYDRLDIVLNAHLLSVFVV